MSRKNDVNVCKRFSFRAQEFHNILDILSGLADMLSQKRVSSTCWMRLVDVNFLKSGPTSERRGGPRIALHSGGKECAEQTD